MSESFAERLEARMRQSHDRLVQRHSDMSRYMTELEERQKQFNRLATALIREVAGPRVQQFAAGFDNARLESDEPLRSRCNLGHCVRFPATAYVEFRVEHNEDVSRLILVFDSQILPVFVQFPRADELSFPLEEVDQQRVATWVETKLFAFLEAYLQLQWLDQYQRDNLATDPVCGMRISKAQAFECQHEDNTYYFCAQQCVDRFRKEPDRYVGSP